MTVGAREGRIVAASAAALVCFGLSTPSAWADDAKLTCIAAADRGQELRDGGKYGAAGEAFATCAREVCPALIAKSCQRWLSDLEVAVPTIVIGARDADGGDVVAARVLVDGEVVAEKLDGMPRRVDPGEHVVRIERNDDPAHTAPQASEVRVVVRAGEKGRPIVVTFAPLAGPASPPSPLPAHGEPGAAAVAESRPPAAPTFLTSRNVVALSLVGAAAVSIAGGIYIGAESRSEANTAAGYRAQYPSNACAHTSSSMCAAWSDAVDAQNRDAVWSDALFTTAGVLAVGAIATWVFWPRASAPRSAIALSISPSLARGRALLGIDGVFE